MPFGEKHIGAGVLDQRTRSTRFDRYVRDLFQHPPVFTASDGIAVPSGVTGATNIMLTGQAGYEYHIKGALQTITAPVYGQGTGLDIALDLTVAEGLEISPGGNNSRSRGAFTVASDKAFYCRAKVLLTDASGGGDFVFGFRKLEAYNTASTGYTDYAVIGGTAAANPLGMTIRTRLNTGTAVSVVTTKTWADGETHQLGVRVSDTGRVRFYFDEAEPPTTTTSFVLDPGDVVAPFLWLVHTADVAEITRLLEFEWGFLARTGE